MRYVVSVAVLCLAAFGANAAQTGRPAMSGQMFKAAPTSQRYTASVNQLNTMGAAGVVAVTNGQVNGGSSSNNDKPSKPDVDQRETERNACVNNNIGIGNTFVWASRFSDVSNYANMVEDTDNPQNNVCFVRVEIKSDDVSRVSVADIPAKYFMWGETIECGSWADAKEMERRILEAKKGARIGGIVAASVGGAGVGVGAMELFGNKLIGGKVQGQKEDKITTYKSYLEYLRTNNGSKYTEVINAMKIVRDGHALTDFNGDEQSFIKDNAK